MEENKLKENLNNPVEIERLYRSDRKAFEAEFTALYPDIKNTEMAAFWKARLDYDTVSDGAGKIRQSDIIALIITCLVAGFLIKLPVIFNFSLKEDIFYERNAGLIFFWGLSLYAILTMKITDTKKLVLFALSFIIPAVYINLLPADKDSQSLTLAYIHLPLLMWCIYGLIFLDFDIKSRVKRIDYIKHNGDLAILGAIVLIAGMAMTVLTIGLFSAIDIKIQRFYMENIALWGLMSAPVVVAFIIRNYPFLTNRIAPVIANIFSPLVLITLVIYLITMPISGKDPYNDREFLIVFNLMLLGVMGIIAFSISEISSGRRQKLNRMILFILSAVTLLINLIALSAIFYRLGEYGISPNRVAVLGSNLLVFINLILIMIDLYKAVFRNGEISHVEFTIAKYLPVYAIWTLLVVFGFPMIFGFN